MIYAAIQQPLYDAQLTLPGSLLLIGLVIFLLVVGLGICMCSTGSSDDDKADRDNLAASEDITER